MVLSGIALAIFDSRIIHRWLRKIKTWVRKNHREENVELGENANSAENESQSGNTQPEPEPIRVDASDESPASVGTRRQHGRQDDISEERSMPRVRAEDVMVPYSILTGSIIFACFIISFIAVMIIRGVVHNLPILFKFFANMYLAGIPLSRSLMLTCLRNYYIWY